MGPLAGFYVICVNVLNDVFCITKSLIEATASWLSDTKSVYGDRIIEALVIMRVTNRCDKLVGYVLPKSDKKAK